MPTGHVGRGSAGCGRWGGVQKVGASPCSPPSTITSPASSVLAPAVLATQGVPLAPTAAPRVIDDDGRIGTFPKKRAPASPCGPPSTAMNPASSVLQPAVLPMQGVPLAPTTAPRVIADNGESGAFPKKRALGPRRVEEEGASRGELAAMKSASIACAAGGASAETIWLAPATAAKPR
jgi:hypothetical protein